METIPRSEIPRLPPEPERRLGGAPQTLEGKSWRHSAETPPRFVVHLEVEWIANLTDGSGQPLHCLVQGEALRALLFVRTKRGGYFPPTDASGDCQGW